MAKLRDIYDPATLRKWTLDAAKNGFEKNLNKIETDKHKLVLKDVGYKDSEPINSEALHKAILEQRDITSALMGTFQLIDKSNGNVVDEKKTVIAHVPYITNRNSAVYGGSEYLSAVQSRLRSGAYTRVQDNGLLEGQINPAGGMQMHVIFHPETAMFTLKVGTINLNLYSILHDMGIADSEIEAAWGKTVYLKNKLAYASDQIVKLHTKLFTY